MDGFLGELRLKKQTIEAMANLDLFRDGGAPFAPLGATPSRSICWGEVGGYRTIAEKVLDGIVRDLNAMTPGGGNSFHNQVKNAFDANAIGFYVGNTAAHEHLRFIAESEAKLIDSYIRPTATSMISQLVRALTDFCPVYTDLLLTNIPKLQNIVYEITKLFDPESKPQPISVSGLPMYLGALVAVAFCSKAPSAAIAYIEGVIQDNLPLRYRVPVAQASVPVPVAQASVPIRVLQGAPAPMGVVTARATPSTGTTVPLIQTVPTGVPPVGMCQACGGQYKGETGLKLHQRSCKKLREAEDQKLIVDTVKQLLISTKK
jgi:hypothetical protein